MASRLEFYISYLIVTGTHSLLSLPVTRTSLFCLLQPVVAGASLPSTYPLSTRKESRQTLSFFFKWNLENKQIQLPVCRVPSPPALSTGAPDLGAGGSSQWDTGNVPIPPGQGNFFKM